MKSNKTDIFVAIFLIILAAASRIFNAQLHVPNYAPLIAISLFGGAFLGKNRVLSLLIPMFGMFLADVYFSLFTSIPGFYNLLGMAFNYGGLVAAAALGIGMSKKPLSVLYHTFAGATLFFLISNLGFFLQGWNGYSFWGLMRTYADGVPFFKYTLEGNLIGSMLIFGSFNFLQKHFQSKLSVSKVN